MLCKAETEKNNKKQQTRLTSGRLYLFQAWWALTAPDWFLLINEKRRVLQQIRTTPTVLIAPDIWSRAQHLFLFKATSAYLFIFSVLCREDCMFLEKKGEKVLMFRARPLYFLMKKKTGFIWFYKNVLISFETFRFPGSGKHNSLFFSYCQTKIKRL